MTKKIDEVVDHLIACCKAKDDSGKKNRRFQVSRQEIREYYEGYRIEGSTLGKLTKALRDEGYLLIPIDTDNLKHAGQFVLSKASVLSNCREYADIE